MESTVAAAAFGCLGGFIRSIIGIFKAKTRQEKIKIGYIFRTIRFSAISGTFMGAIFSFNPIISFTAGYAGSDILEGLVASFKRTKIGKEQFDI
ncbi:MAG TPA: hypothetical protein VHA12_01395 [Candidatus Nanoarchaeia archaeon]|nr:hypothetical protein [Candidatus Nanoarchaeia archaeon]